MTEKTVLCIRHGESTFNAAHRETGIDPIHYDARLTERGLGQVRDAREKLRDVPIDLVITTPLTRAIQTATGIFGEHFSQPRIQVEAIHRERLESSCDIGRSPLELAADYPALELDHLPEIWWHAEGEPDERGVCLEPAETLGQRIEEFKTFILSRPEQNIAVVGHGTFFFHLGGRWLDNCGIMRMKPDMSGEAPEELG